MSAYYITTKASSTSFALLGQTANRAEARLLAKDLGGTVRTEAEYTALAAAAAPVAAPAPEAPVAATKAKGTRAPVVNTSTAERPCKLVWQIADDVNAATPGAKRSVVLAECVRQGVAFYTARTQYQQWLGVQKEMAAREAAAAAK
jgi:hypothetical protein